MKGDIDYLQGLVTVRAAAPAYWELVGLRFFYDRPNEPEWGGTLCRVLHHESIHYWMFLGSAYMAHLVAGEWAQLLEYERTGYPPPRAAAKTAFTAQAAGQPFSPWLLNECWARLWDVHTRSPAQVIREEGLTVPDGVELERQFEEYGGVAYSSAALDLFMTQGVDARLYAKPYRWMLEQTRHNSRFVGYVFPVLCYHAFNTADPVGFFCRAFAAAAQSDAIHKALAVATGFCNRDWPEVWPIIEAEAIAAGYDGPRSVALPSAEEVFAQGCLREHPLYRDYPSWYQVMRRHMQDRRPLRIVCTREDGSEEQTTFAEACPELATPLDRQPGREMSLHALADNPAFAFIFPGQPICRELLGHHLSPPCVRFTNLTVFARRFGSTCQEASCALQRRVTRFRLAEKAVLNGRPPDAYLRALPREQG